MRTITKAAVLAFSLLLVGSAAAASPLDGKTFAGETGEKGKTKADKDTFIFQDGKFRSTACDKYGFGAAAYTAKQEGTKTTFESETTSAKEGTMKWTGAADGDDLTGTAVWTRAGKKPVDYWFKAKLKK